MTAELPLSAPTEPLAAGESVVLEAGTLVADRYRPIRELGRGGVGIVWEVEDQQLAIHVALKLVRGLDARAIGSLKQELQLARRVTHPNVCRTHDLGVHRVPGGSVPFLTMELIEGETLAERIRRDGPLSVEATARIATQIAAALDAAHAVGVVHRDLTSRNVMIAGDRVVVTDFGLALDVHGKVAPLVGTAAYMAPEQVEGGEVGPAADVYAFGVVLMEMLTARLPFSGETPREVAERRLVAPPLDPGQAKAGIDPRWRAVILRCLSRDPAARFSGAGDVVAAAMRSPARTRRNVVTTLVVLVAAVAAVVGGARYLREARAERVTRLVHAAQAADYRAGTALAREALALDPTSRPARLALARVLFDRSRLAPEGRHAALEEGRALTTELVREEPDDLAARDLLVTGLYLAGERIDALLELPRLPERRRLQVGPRIEWTEGWVELARAGLDRCLTAMPDDPRCLHLHQFEVEMAEGRAGIERVLASPRERDYPPLSRVRMRVLVGRIDEAALVAETGFADGTLDLLDAPYVNGILAAARHQDEDARRDQEILAGLVRSDDGPVALRLAGALQLAELAALRGDEDGVVDAARMGVELGLFNAELWEHGVLFASMQDRLAPIAADCRAHAATELALAHARGVVMP